MKKEAERDIKYLQKKLDDCEKEKQEYLAGWQRARADFLNYQKQEIERVGELINATRAEMILEVLEIFDNLERATRQDVTDAQDNKTVQGFLQIKKQFEDFLNGQGIEKIKAVGEKFNPDLHEAVEQIESGDKESGTILEVAQKGYTINGQLLRPAKVKIVK